MPVNCAISEIFASPTGDCFFVVERELATRSHSVSKWTASGKLVWRTQLPSRAFTKAAISLDERNIFVASPREISLLNENGVLTRRETIVGIERIIPIENGAYTQTESQVIYSFGRVCHLLPDEKMPLLLSVSPNGLAQIRSDEDDYVLILAAGKRVNIRATGVGILKVHWAKRWVFICESASAMHIFDRETGTCVTQIIPGNGWHYGEVYFNQAASLVTACCMNFQEGNQMAIESFEFDGNSLKRRTVYHFLFAPVHASLFASGTKYATGIRAVIDCATGSVNCTF